MLVDRIAYWCPVHSLLVAYNGDTSQTSYVICQSSICHHSDQFPLLLLLHYQEIEMPYVSSVMLAILMNKKSERPIR